MRDVLRGLKEVFWNPAEQRFRALIRFIAILGLFLFAASLVEGIGVFLGIGFSRLGVSSAVVSAVVQLAVVALILAATFAIVWVVDRRHLGDLGFARGRRWRADLLAGLGIGVGMAIGTISVALIAGVASVEGVFVARETGQFEGLSPFVGVVAGSVLFVLLTLLYELLFRGYIIVNTAEGLLGAVGQRGSILAGVAVSSLVFALAHVALPEASTMSAVPVGLLGLLLAGTVAVTGQLALALGLHTAWAVLLGPVFGLPFRGFELSTALVDIHIQGPTLVTGGSFGPEGGLVALFGIAVGATGVVAYLRRQGSAFSFAPELVVPDLWVDSE